MPALLLAACGSAPPPAVEGPLVQWQPVTISFTGPETSEDADPNPFRDYRLNLAFEHAASGTALEVPGYFAADGNAAESSASTGRVWRAVFLPTQPGEWTFRASFREGVDVAISDDPEAGLPSDFDGASGSFTIAPADPGSSSATSRTPPATACCPTRTTG